MNTKQLPERWTEKKFGEIALLNRGHNPPKSQFIHKPREGYVRFYQIRDGNNDDYEVYVPDTPKLHKVEPDDILMVAYRHIGRVFRGAKGAFNVALCKITNKDRSIIDNDYLFYIIPTEFVRGELMKQAERSLIPSMSVKHLAEIKIPVPPLPEQKRIVAILDEAFEGIDRAIANTKKNLANSRELFESYLNAIFTQKGDGWVDAAIEDRIKFIDYRGRTPNKTEGGMRLITAKNVKMGFLQLEPQEFVNPDIYDDWMTRGIPQKGDVLFTTEAPLGNVAQLDTDEKVVFAQRVIIMQPDEKFINKTFLKFLLLSNIIQQRIQNKGTGATAQGIKASLLKKIPISFPSDLLIQEAIVLKLETLEADTKRLETIYRQKLAALNELKQSILQKAFTGELTADTPKAAKEAIAA
ncbi:MAG: restriction endonuclease subunit S [Kastovskya adunca ATA6-11-RM4]|jgi:type I restriction enzyme S subunit|nr:restriction endonuclease subunit S [Kastovskya adunca ATA6-11-RM4]